MPNFMYTIIFLSGLGWFGLYKILISKTPETNFNIILFLGAFFFAVSFTLSIPIYFILINKFNRFVNTKKVYRRALKWGLVISFLITTILTIRAFA